MKQWVIPAVVLLAVGGAGLGIGWSINEWSGGDGATGGHPPTPTANPVTITATEAEEIAKNWLWDQRDSFYSGVVITGIECHKKEFNRTTNGWIVSCPHRYQFPDGRYADDTVVLSVDARTRAIALVR